MMSNLFSSFDPSTGIFSLNWIGTLFSIDVKFREVRSIEMQYYISVMFSINQTSRNFTSIIQLRSLLQGLLMFPMIFLYLSSLNMMAFMILLKVLNN